eukprot:SAG31_NODE_98_length_25640_cov_9.936744_5_plen_77_part_00
MCPGSHPMFDTRAVALALPVLLVLATLAPTSVVPSVRRVLGRQHRREEQCHRERVRHEAESDSEKAGRGRGARSEA